MLIAWRALTLARPLVPRVLSTSAEADGDGHPSSGGLLVRRHRWLPAGIGVDCRPRLAIAPGRGCLAGGLLALRWCALAAPFHPSPVAPPKRRPSAGLLSVALVLASPRAAVSRIRVDWEPGSSSAPALLQGYGPRPSGGLGFTRMDHGDDTRGFRRVAARNMMFSQSAFCSPVLR